MKEEFRGAEMTLEQDDSIFHQLNKIRTRNYGFGNQLVSGESRLS